MKVIHRWNSKTQSFEDMEVEELLSGDRITLEDGRTGIVLFDEYKGSTSVAPISYPFESFVYHTDKE